MSSNSEQSALNSDSLQVSNLVRKALSSWRKWGGQQNKIASFVAIKKYIASHHEVDIDLITPQIKKCLKIGVANKSIIKTVKGKVSHYKLRSHQSSTNTAQKISKPTQKIAVAESNNSKVSKTNNGSINTGHFLCDICKVHLTSKKNLKNHESGRKHVNNLRKLQQKGKSNKKCIFRFESSSTKADGDINSLGSSDARSHKTDILLDSPSTKSDKKNNSCDNSSIKSKNSNNSHNSSLSKSDSKSNSRDSSSSKSEKKNKSLDNISTKEDEHLFHLDRKGNFLDSPTTNSDIGSKSSRLSSNSDKKNMSSESSVKSDKYRKTLLKSPSTVTLYSEQQQSLVTNQVNLDMSNQSNKNSAVERNPREGYSEPRSRPRENHHYPYRNNAHFSGYFRQPPRDNFRNFNNRNFEWQQQWRPNRPMSNNGNIWFPPPNKDFRYFQRPYMNHPNQEMNSPYFQANGECDNGEWIGYKSNENFSPFTNDAPPVDNFAISKIPLLKSPPIAFTETVKDAPNTEMVKKSVSASNETKVQRTPPVRKNQNIRALSNVSVNQIVTENDVESDDKQDEVSNDKQAERRNVSSENMTGKRIAHWINPSNQKDAAEVRRLVTAFSKSKKKENLLKMKQQSDSRNERRDSLSESINNVLESTSETNHSEPRVLYSSKEKLDDVSSTQILEITPESKRRKRSKSEPNLNSPGSSSFCKLRTKSKNVQESSPKKSFSEKKRKSSFEQRNAKKKHVTPEDMEASIDAVIRGKPSMSTAVTFNENVELMPQDIVPTVKLEPLDSIDNSQLLNLNELAQKQGGGENNCPGNATMTPVESLINLFASGNIQVKKEFDDPLIDAIRTVDPAVLDKVCEGQSTTSAKPSNPIPSTSVESPKSTASNVPPSVTGSLKSILRQLQRISNKEEKVKESLLQADHKIQEYQSLLDEWKTKKIKFQCEEETLRNHRNTLVKSMNDLVTEPSTVCYSTDSLELVDNSSSNSTSSLDSAITTPSLPNNFPRPKVQRSDSHSVMSVEEYKLSSTDTDCEEVIIEENALQVEEDEIAILPLPQKSNDGIPIIELDVMADSVLKSNLTTAEIDDENVYNMEAVLEKLSNLKNMEAHKIMVNSIQVFEDFLYTCSNDGTAKRFDLKDLSQTVTYQHERKNVTHLCVEKVRGVTLVFTACSTSKIISSYKAEDGCILKIFNFPCNVASICKGRGKIYAGLRNGSISTCNWKEQKEIVNVGEPIRSMAATYQGCLSLLVTLATNGHVSIRDAERNGLLIRNLKPRKNIPLFMTVHSDCIYLSGSGVLVVLEIATGRCVGKYELSAPYTSLAVYQDHILTTSYSGFVRCHSKQREKDVKVYYGAGNSSLTCINVYNGWVFTGNRSGVVDVFKFDPFTSLPCQIGKCDLIFSRLEDLEFHAFVGRDHDLPTGGSKCSWRFCYSKFPKTFSKEDIKAHIREHIKASKFTENQPLYNFSS